MPELSVVSETLYVPLLGRIHASKHDPKVLYDKAALALEPKLPASVEQATGQNEYTYLASAVRSKNVDAAVGAFLTEYPRGTVVNVGCGLETAYLRNDNGIAVWFELDLPEVLQLRSGLLPEQERDRHLPYSMFDYRWIDIVKQTARLPVLVIASGLFYYFHEEQVIDFIRHLAVMDNVRIVFDAVSSAGIHGTRHYMKKMRRLDAEMFFSVDHAKKLATAISPDVSVLEEKKYYGAVIAYPGIQFDTRAKMFFSDLLRMVKMIQLRIYRANEGTSA